MGQLQIGRSVGPLSGGNGVPQPLLAHIQRHGGDANPELDRRSSQFERARIGSAKLTSRRGTGAEEEERRRKKWKKRVKKSDECEHAGTARRGDHRGRDTLTVMEPWEALFKALTELRDRWPGSPQEWTYDRRLKCVTSSIPLTREADARAAMSDALPMVWSVETLPGASDDARGLIEKCGGLRAAQLLFWGGGAGPGAFGLWWPWGDGTSVSLRIGLHHVDLPKERYPRLRDVFGIPQASAPG